MVVARLPSVVFLSFIYRTRRPMTSRNLGCGDRKPSARWVWSGK